MDEKPKREFQSLRDYNQRPKMDNLIFGQSNEGRRFLSDQARPQLLDPSISFSWAISPGEKTTITLGAEDTKEARVELAAMARRAGWKPARWWEYWRWRENTFRELIDSQL